MEYKKVSPSELMSLIRKLAKDEAAALANLQAAWKQQAIRDGVCNDR